MTDKSSKFRILLASAILVPVLLYWGFSRSPQEHPTQAEILSEKTDYYMNSAKLTEWNVDGAILRTLTTPYLEHNPNQQLSYLSEPRYSYHRENGSIIKVSSRKGTAYDDNSRTELAGTVRVLDNPESGSSSELATEKLTIFPDREYAETDQLVTIQSSESELKGVGMDINFNTRVLNLHSRVEGTHNNAD